MTEASILPSTTAKLQAAFPELLEWFARPMYSDPFGPPPPPLPRPKRKPARPSLTPKQLASRNAAGQPVTRVRYFADGYELHYGEPEPAADAQGDDVVEDWVRKHAH